MKHLKLRMHMLSVERMQCFRLTTPIDVPLNKEAEEIRGRKEQERVENQHIVETSHDVAQHVIMMPNRTVHFVAMTTWMIPKTKGMSLKSLNIS